MQFDYSIEQVQDKILYTSSYGFKYVFVLFIFESEYMLRVCIYMFQLYFRGASLEISVSCTLVLKLRKAQKA